MNTATPAPARPLALGLSTEPAKVAGAMTPGVRFDPARQISVNAAGTPLAAYGDDRSRTSGGMTGPTEVEMMDFH